ncbi:MAG: HDIG domain-containing protein [bacterium]|nr:HDIG domain-containing protein [bacterium]
MIYITDLHEGDSIKGIYLCKSKKTCQKPTGKSYYSLTLQDKTGTLDARVWNLTSGINNFNNMDYIHVKGKVVYFQNALQLHIDQIRVAQEGEYDKEDYVPLSSQGIEKMYGELTDYIGSIKNKYLKKLAESIFIEDAEFKRTFTSHSAAKSVHHGFQGGLLEHTLSVVKVSDFMSKQYPLVNRDLLLVAAMFHDIGKTEEISAFPENDYTDDGQLLGHIMIGVEMVGIKIRQIEGFPHALASQLKHCLIAHHGTLEYGSPKKPATIEALALSLADMMDARMQTMKEGLEAADPKLEWIGYNRFFESNIRKTTNVD